MARLRKKPAPTRTISVELHNIWLQNKRKKDAEKIVALAIKKNEVAGSKIYPTSKPTIEKALIYGHCLEDSLRNLINEYFEQRHKIELEQTVQIQHVFALV